MFLSSDKIEERRLFTYEERSATLKRSSGVCACCSKKLTTKTMTMDHIIPISRGGTNDMENLVALCLECNKAKGNLLYMPRAYYMAIKNLSELRKMERHVEQWFQTIQSQFDLEKFPLIAPVTNLQLSARRQVQRSQKKKQGLYIPSLILEWKIISKESYEEIEAVTGLDLREIRKTLPKINTFYKEDPAHTPTVALYSLRKKTTDKILAVVAVQVTLEEKHMNVWMPWSEMPKSYHGPVLHNLVNLLLDSLTRIANCTINTYSVTATSDNPNAIRDFCRAACSNEKMGLYYRLHFGKLKSIGEENWNMAMVNRVPDHMAEVWKNIQKPEGESKICGV